MWGYASCAKVFAICMFGLVEAKPVEISDPAVVRFSFPIFNLGNEQQIDRIARVIFGQVEWVDSSAFGIAKHVDRQVILSSGREGASGPLLIWWYSYPYMVMCMICTGTNTIFGGRPCGARRDSTIPSKVEQCVGSIDAFDVSTAGHFLEELVEQPDENVLDIRPTVVFARSVQTARGTVSRKCPTARRA